MNQLQLDAHSIINEAIKEVLPEKAVEKALALKSFTGEVTVVSIGKAAWNMAMAAYNILGNQIKSGIVITKYGHAKGAINGFQIIEAGHPVPDENSVMAAKEAIKMVSDLKVEDQVIFLVSGGGSALFELPLEGVTLSDLMQVTKQLLRCGADITEINAVRKHLSGVKGGRFAQYCSPASVYSVVLSDVIGDKLDAIASGPAYPDSTTSQEAREVIAKYNLTLPTHILNALEKETPKELGNVETVITGNVTGLCVAAARKAKSLGYNPIILSTSLECEAKEAARIISSIAIQAKDTIEYGIKAPCAIIFGGETTVKVKGTGLGGRNQELALAAAKYLDGKEDILLFSIGSDGTDGPTDAAGGIVDDSTYEKFNELGLDYKNFLNNNDSYRALSQVGGLIKTGATGTNVNDLMVGLCK